MTRLRVALLCNGASLEVWHMRCLDLLEQVADLAGVIVAPERPVSGSGSWLLRSYARRVRERSTVDARERLAHLPRLDGEPGAFDAVLALGRVAVPDEVASAARHGLWCFEHERGDELLPFLREVAGGEDVTRAALLAYSAGSEPQVIEEGWFRTDTRSYVGSRERVLDAAAAWPARACERLLAGVEGPGARTAGSPRAPKRVGFGRLWARTTRSRLEIAWERLFRHPQWNVGVLRAPAGALLAPGGYDDAGIEWFRLEGRDGFLADPFGIARDGTLRVLCEYFGYRDTKGRICTFDYSPDGFTREHAPALTLPGHASYPFLLEESGEIYCVPETCDANEVALFRATEFPRRWSKDAVLVEGFAGVDPTVFRHEGRWWLTCTRQGLAEDVELWAWHAADLRGPWEPHERNPVKADVRSARPGGAPFVHDDALYRPAQDCSRSYGWRIAIQRVTRLTPTEFAEEPATVLEASPQSPFPDGRHTLTPVGDLVLIDGRRTVFVWAALRAFLGILARNAVRRGRR